MRILKFNESINNDYREIGKEYWFEYHCLESPKSTDAELWYRSHQKVKVIELVELGGGDSKSERLNNGEPSVYKVEFHDGFIGSVFEDELLDSEQEYDRPNPPKNIRESVSTDMVELSDALIDVFDRFNIPHKKEYSNGEFSWWEDEKNSRIVIGNIPSSYRDGVRLHKQILTDLYKNTSKIEDRCGRMVLIDSETRYEYYWISICLCG